MAKIQPDEIDQGKFAANSDVWPPLDAGWQRVLGEEFASPYMAELAAFLSKERAAGKELYPQQDEVFSAFHACAFEDVKVVFVGQDPYHGPGQAHGLCFSVRHGVRVPPSLVNIYRELEDDLGIPPAPHGYLDSWANQGVLLLNATLTVEAHKAGSHQRKGWEQFTDAAIAALNREREGLVFVLWGSYAQKKGASVDRERHCVISGPHPSPLSAHRGFFGSRPFSQVNRHLIVTGQEPVNWRLPAAPVEKAEATASVSHA